MENRLENLRLEIDRLIMKKQPDNSRCFHSHLYGVSNFCALLALRRNLNPELAITCGMLHDIYQITDGTTEKHAVKGAKVAKKILKDTKSYSDGEIDMITAAISVHSDKKGIHEPYGELLTDADVLSHCLYDPDYPVNEREIVRYKNLLKELGCNYE